MEHEVRIGVTRLRLLQGDITEQDTDAIVNAANTSLLGGGGVDGAIHAAGGPSILEACKAIVADIGRCNTGEAVITTGGNLKAPYVIHTVGPVWNGGNRGERGLLSSAYHRSLALAHDKEMRSIAFPSISTGAYRFPIENAAHIALTTVMDFVKLKPFDEVRFVLFSADDFDTYRRVLTELVQTPGTRR